MAQNRSWTIQDVQNFFTLVSHTEASQVIKHGGQLSRLLSQINFPSIANIIGDTSTLGTTESERYTNYLGKVKQNPFGKWLFGCDDFKRAHGLFTRKRLARRNPAYCIEWAELRFLRCAAIVGFFVHQKDSGYQRQNPDSRQVKKAIGNIQKLQGCLAVGVRTEDYLKTQELSKLLAELLSTLKSTKRKPRTDENSIGRECVALISQELLETFGEASPQIVTHLAAVLGYTPDATAISRQLQRARKKHQDAKKATARAAVVDALVKARNKPA